jgi:hypothetical protein
LGKGITVHGFRGGVDQKDEKLMGMLTGYSSWSVGRQRTCAMTGGSILGQHGVAPVVPSCREKAKWGHRVLVKLIEVKAELEV